MKKTLQSIASQLSEDDIQEIIRLKKAGGKRVAALQRKRNRLAAEIERIDAELAGLSDGTGAAPRHKRGRKPGKKNTASKTTKKKHTGRRNNLSAAVRSIFQKTNKPLKASQVVDSLPKAGIHVADIADMRKRISVVLASQKNHFKQVSRGLYQLISE